MKHRRVVGGPKKKNRIQEVNATPDNEYGNTSPLESPNLGTSPSLSSDRDAVAGAVQRFLANRRNRRLDDNTAVQRSGTGSHFSFPSSVSSSRSNTDNNNGGSDHFDDDDEPDNDSGDEGLKRRRNFLLAGGTILPTAWPPTSSLPPTNELPTTTPLPILVNHAPPQSTTTKTNDTTSDINNNNNKNTERTFQTPLKSNVSNAATSLADKGDDPNMSNNHSDHTQDVVHPLTTLSATATTTTTTDKSPVLPTHQQQQQQQYHQRAPSVSFSMQTTDLESGQPAGPLAQIISNDDNNNDNNNNTNNGDESTALERFLQHFTMTRNETMEEPSPEAATTTTQEEKGTAIDNNNKNEWYSSDEQTPLLTTRRDGSIRPGGVVDLNRAVPLSASGDDDDDLELGSFHSEADSTVGKDQNTTTQDDGHTAAGGQSILEQLFEEGTQAVYDTIAEVTTEAWEQYDESCHYDWREFWKGGGVLKFCRWLATGMAPENYKQSDDEIQENLNSLARMLSLLREYQERFGMPDIGGGKDQEYVLREVTKDLYLGGSPIWALEPVMKRVAEGLTGKRGVDFFMLPRRAFIFAPSSGATAMFRITRGYDMQRLDDMENVAVRLASFASNTGSVASVPTRWPKPQELRRAFRTESLAGFSYSKEEMAEEILNLASEAEGLFYYIRNHQSKCYANRESPLYAKGENSGKLSELGEFWTVEDDTRELFSRLAAIEAATAIDKIDVDRKPLYSPLTVVMFRVCASACACAFWFNGSWVDILVSGVLAELVAMIGSSSLLSKQERIIFEAVASFVVGFTAACIALTWPDHCCFGAMAISGVLDLLQGFRVVYSIIEIMSRHTVTGGADFLEGVFFTTLIAYCLRFGQYIALETLGEPDSDEYLQCTKGVSEWWYLIFVPVGAIAWSGLFNPHYFDLPIMAAHGVLGYLVSWQFYKAASNTQMNNFLAAMAVTFSAGIISRFTGRQALGNTVAGLYVLLPGAYLVTQVYSDRIDGFLWQIILRAIIIGIGGWTGTILCTPTLLGINKGLMEYTKAVPTLVENASTASDNMSSSSSIASGQNFRRRDKSVRKNGTGALLFF